VKLCYATAASKPALRTGASLILFHSKQNFQTAETEIIIELADK
jgi:hypothetical protein